MDINLEQDFKEFFLKSREELLQPILSINDENILKREIFKDANKMSRAELWAAYAKGDFFTIPAHYVGNNWFQNIRDMAVDDFSYKLLLNKYPDAKNTQVLVYGAGPGIRALKIHSLGYNVTWVDIPHQHFEFMKYLCNKYDIGIDGSLIFVPMPDTDRLGLETPVNKYDYIVNSDVMEHVPEPESTMDYILTLLKDKGWMFLSTFFDDCDGTDPSHLKRNTERFNHWQTWLGIVVEKGLFPFVKDEAGVMKGFQKLNIPYGIY